MNLLNIWGRRSSNYDEGARREKTTEEFSNATGLKIKYESVTIYNRSNEWDGCTTELVVHSGDTVVYKVQNSTVVINAPGEWRTNFQKLLDGANEVRLKNASN